MRFAGDRPRTYSELLKALQAAVVVRNSGGNMLKRRLFTLLVLPAVSLFASPASQVWRPRPPPGFHAAVAMPNSSNGSEPSLAISNDGSATYPGSLPQVAAPRTA